MATDSITLTRLVPISTSQAAMGEPQRALLTALDELAKAEDQLAENLSLRGQVAYTCIRECRSLAASAKACAHRLRNHGDIGT